MKNSGGIFTGGFLPAGQNPLRQIPARLVFVRLRLLPLTKSPFDIAIWTFSGDIAFVKSLSTAMCKSDLYFCNDS